MQQALWVHLSFILFPNYYTIRLSLSIYLRLFNFYLAVFAFVNWPYLLLSMTDVQWLLWLFLDLIFTFYTQRARGTPLHPGGKNDKWTGVCPGNFDATKEQYNKWWAWTQQGAEAAATATAKETAQKVMTHLQHLIWGQRQLIERVQWVITINQAAGCTRCPVRRTSDVRLWTVLAFA